MKISVAICTYNGAKYIKEQLNSILEQTLLPDEIVICDDCSTDDTVTVIRRVLEHYTGKFILINNPRNIGYKKNFVQAMSLCKGDIIFLSDQDDVWAKDKIALLSRVFEDNKKAILVFHDAILVDEQLKFLYNSFWKVLEFTYEKFLHQDYAILLEKNVVQGSACAFRKSLFYKALPFPLEAVHDEWLALVAVAEGEIVPLPQPLMEYRQSDSNIFGGLPLSFTVKVKKWTMNLDQFISYHFQKLQDRNTIYEVYSKRNSTDNTLAKKFAFMWCSKFLKRRVVCVKKRDLSLIKLLPMYFRLYACKRQSVKMFLSDLMAMYFNSNKI